MIVFNKDSWHYRLIIYTFGEHFFEEKTEDWNKTITENQGKKIDEMRSVYKYKAKTVNLCPYCRAVFGASLMLPLTWIWKLFPHKPKKELTHKETMKRLAFRGKVVRIGVSSFNFSLGIKNIILEEWWAAILQIGVGLFILFMPNIFKVSGKWMERLLKLFGKEKKAPKPYKEKVVKNPSLFMLKLSAEHEKICPPIFFIEKSEMDDCK